MVPFQYEQFQNFSNKILSFIEMLPALNGVVNNLVNTNATLQPCGETIQLYQRTYKWDYVKRIEFLWLKNWIINGQAIGVFLGTEYALFQCIVALAIISGCYCKRINSHEYKIRPQPQEPLTHHQLIYRYIQSCCHGLENRRVKERRQCSLFEAQCRPQDPKKSERTEQNVFSIM